VDRLNGLSADSLRAVFGALRLRPDTTAVPVAPDTAATPDGDLLQIRRWLDQRSPSRSQVVTRPNLHGPDGLQSTPHYRHYFVIDVPTDLASSDPPRPSARPVTWGYRSFGGVDWLPGGTQIVVSGTPDVQRPLDRGNARNLYVADLQPRRIRRLLKIEDYRLTDPNVTSNGTTVAFRARRQADSAYARHQIGLFALDGRSEPELITDAFPHDIGPIRWSSGGWYLYTTAPTRGGRPLYRFAPFARSDTTAPRSSPSLAPDQSASRDTFALDTTMVRTAQHTRMTRLPRGIHAFDVTDATAVYAATGPDAPSDLFTNTVSFGNERRVSSLNDWRARRRLPSSTRLTAASDSFAVDGWLTRPVAPSDTLRSPLAVWPRGGPPGFTSGRMTPQAWLARHYLAAQGFAVLEVKPRGTAGYGPSFRRASVRDWGNGPMRDLLAVADSATARAWVDSTRQVLVGEGYGGYLATWTLTQTDRFRAAVAQGGVYDLPALYGEGRAGRRLPAQFGGYPWEGARRTLPSGVDSLLADSLTASLPDGRTPRSALHRHSPLSAVDRIQTPLLLLHGGDDHRTGTAQPQRLYKALKTLGRPVEYVRYPDVGHDVAETASPRQRLDRLVRLYEFLKRFTERPAR
jgi:dipeptidyl aminopeptidase/acylaminoacyl peptidase